MSSDGTQKGPREIHPDFPKSTGLGVIHWNLADAERLLGCSVGYVTEFGLDDAALAADLDSLRKKVDELKQRVRGELEVALRRLPGEELPKVSSANNPPAPGHSETQRPCPGCEAGWQLYMDVHLHPNNLGHVECSRRSARARD